MGYEPSGGAGARAGDGRCWPTREQTWLLRAALLPDERAIDGWRSWCDAVGPRRADRGSQRLLPLVVHNLHALGVPGDDDLVALRGLHARIWAENRVRFHRLAAVLRALEGAGVPTLVLKGGALASLVYDDPGLRPMSDLDVAVPAASAPRALGILGHLGWRTEVRPDLALAVTHAAACRHETHGELDLHWHVLWQCCSSASDDAFWDAAHPAEIGGAPTRVLCPADQLLHVLAHGVRWAPLPPLRWAADAIVLLRRAGVEFDWGRLAAQSAARGLTLTVREALGWLVQALDLAVPAPALATLGGRRVPLLERVEFAVNTRPWGRLGAFPLYVLHNARTSGGLLRSLPRFPGYLRRLYGLDHLHQLPATLLAKRGAKARADRHMAREDQ